MLGLTGLAACGAGIWLPPLDGSFSGKLSPLGADAGIQLDWTLEASSSQPGERALRFSFVGAGTAVEGRATLTLPEASGSWRLDRADLELGPWWSALGQRRFPALKPITASGRIELSGAGTFATEPEGIYAGEFRAKLSGAAFKGANNAWSLSGVEANVVLPNLPDLSTAPRQRIAFSSGAAGELPLGAGFAEFELLRGQILRVHAFELEALGGTIRCKGFDVDLAKPDVTATVQVEGLELAALRPYIPQAVADAQGRLDGHVALRWSSASGFSLGDGDLSLRKDAPASIRLASSPGFLSSRVPSRLKLLAGVVDEPNPAKRALEEIELGQEALVVDSVQAELRPDRAGAGATAVVKIVAHPTDATSVKVVRLNVNVSGPLADVLRFGMSGRTSLSR